MFKIGKRIKNIRETIGMSQQELADMLKITRQAISKIENNDRKISAEELKKISDIFNVSIDTLLNISKTPAIILEEKKPEEKTEIRISVPRKNINKFKEVLLYILNKVGSKPNIGESALYKLLYFIDFNYYEIYEEQLMGIRYKKNHFGPTPMEFGKIIADMIEKKEVTKVKNEYFKYPQTKYLPLKEADLSLLKANEKEIIDNVLHDLSNKNASELRDYSHKDVPWLTTEDGEIIDYESVFYRTELYSKRKYDEDIQKN